MGSIYFSLFRIPVVFKKFLEIIFICDAQFKCLSIVMPRKLKLSTYSMSVSAQHSCRSCTFFCGMWNAIAFVFFTFKDSLLACNQSFTFANSLLILIDNLSLKINDQRSDRVHEFNFLGTIIHETLEWTRHIDKVANKISRTLGILNKLKHVLPVYTLKTMYDALIVPHLNYNILLWGFNSNRMSKLQQQKRQLES